MAFKHKSRLRHLCRIFYPLTLVRKINLVLDNSKILLSWSSFAHGQALAQSRGEGSKGGMSMLTDSMFFL